MVARRTQQLVDLLSSKKGEVNMSKWFSWFTYVFVHNSVARRQGAHGVSATGMTS